MKVLWKDGTLKFVFKKPELVVSHTTKQAQTHGCNSNWAAEQERKYSAGFQPSTVDNIVGWSSYRVHSDASLPTTRPEFYDKSFLEQLKAGTEFKQARVAMLEHPGQ